MYYAKIDEFVKALNKGNIEELKPQLRKYVGQLMLLIKDQDNNLSLDDIDSMIDILIMREEFQEDNELKLMLNKDYIKELQRREIGRAHV